MDQNGTNRENMKGKKINRYWLPVERKSCLDGTELCWGHRDKIMLRERQNLKTRARLGVKLRGQ